MANKRWQAEKNTAARHGFTFREWLFVNETTGYAVSSYQTDPSGFFVIPPAGVGWDGPDRFTRRTDACRAANRAAKVGER